jgi:Domain of unknown function (DUF3859)
MRAPLLVAALIALSAGSAAAQTTSTVEAPGATVTGITITKAGTYTGDSVSAPARSGQESPTGTVGTHAAWTFVSDSNDVSGKPGTQFGVEFRIDGEPRGDGVTVYLLLIFPPQGIHNPNTGRTMYAAKVAYPNMKIGALCLVGYGFDNAWEIVPGQWTQQIWYQDKMLAERKFTVGKAE